MTDYVRCYAEYNAIFICGCVAKRLQKTVLNYGVLKCPTRF